MKKKIILIGGGGHCKSCIDTIENTNAYNIVGILDKKEKIGTKLLGYNFIGTDDDISNFKEKKVSFFITIGQIKNNEPRQKIFKLLKDLHCDISLIKSKFSYVSKYAHINEGTIVMNGAIVNASSHIGYNCIINTNAIIEHDAAIGNNCHISTGVIINGTSIIGNNVFIGSNSTVINNINICDNVIIGAGSVITKSITESGTYVGSPLRKIS